MGTPFTYAYSAKVRLSSVAGRLASPKQLPPNIS